MNQNSQVSTQEIVDFTWVCICFGIVNLSRSFDYFTSCYESTELFITRRRAWWFHFSGPQSKGPKSSESERRIDPSAANEPNE